ncbi:MAG: WbqC family protein [Candidatus Atribacteria bacterium]|nr:WbqC family protein [Candidatus Atribacteria bacterium]
MIRSDIFVILDDAQFSKGDFHNRNRIKTKDGPKWLTIPVHAKKNPINEIRINKEFTFSKMKWNEYHIHLLEENYSKTPFFDSVFNELNTIYLKEAYENLIDINMNIIKFLKDAFNIDTPIYLSSELNLNGELKSTERLIEICNHFEANQYLSGKDGPKYMNMKLFEEANIDVIIQNYTPEPYHQPFGEFTPYMTALDSLFNNGTLR